MEIHKDSTHMASVTKVFDTLHPDEDSSMLASEFWSFRDMRGDFGQKSAVSTKDTVNAGTIS